MTGHRVANRQRKQHNPLYSLFMLLLSLVIALLLVVLILGAKLRKANEQLAQYRASQTEQVEETEFGVLEQTEPEETERELPTIDKGVVNRGEETPKEEPNAEERPTQSEQPKSELGKVGWLDLTGHTELEAAPASVFDEYKVRYTTDGVNVRSGPGTDYSKTRMLDLGTEVAAVAEQNGWNLVGINDGKFGWIKSEYLAEERPESPKEEEIAAETPTSETEEQNAE